MNRAERIFRLHKLLKTHRSVPLSELMAELQSSRATVVRDLGYMRDFMQAPILYHREVNGYAYDAKSPEFELPGLWFNAGELYALLASEQLLETVQPGLLSPYIGPLRARIRKLLEQSGHRADTVTSRINLVPIGARRVAGEQFGLVAGAVLEGKVLDIEYHGRGKDAKTRRRVHPHKLLHYRNNWYLVAWCESAGELRTFSLDKIRSAVSADRPIRAVDEQDIDRCLRGSFGIFSGPAKAWAVLRFTPLMARWVADEEWHPDQIGQWRGESYELQVPYSDPRELLMDILRYGPEVEVIAPEELRKEVAVRLAKAAAQY